MLEKKNLQKVGNTKTHPEGIPINPELVYEGNFTITTSFLCVSFEVKSSLFHTFLQHNNIFYHKYLQHLQMQSTNYISNYRLLRSVN